MLYRSCYTLAKRSLRSVSFCALPSWPKAKYGISGQLTKRGIIVSRNENSTKIQEHSLFDTPRLQLLLNPHEVRRVRPAEACRASIRGSLVVNTVPDDAVVTARGEGPADGEGMPQLKAPPEQLQHLPPLWGVGEKSDAVGPTVSDAYIFFQLILILTTPFAHLDWDVPGLVCPAGSCTRYRWCLLSRMTPGGADPEEGR